MYPISGIVFTSSSNKILYIFLVPFIVNEHGCIHQTVTVKSVEQGSTICVGDAETKDSWFPGCSWTILCC